MSLNPDNVPQEFRHLLPFAERWGIGDDYDRERAVSTASSDDLSDLVSAIQAMPTDALFDWLAGPESFNPQPSHEYLALTCMIMAYDSARVKLQKRQIEPGAAPNDGPAMPSSNPNNSGGPPSVS